MRPPEHPSRQGGGVPAGLSTRFIEATRRELVARGYQPRTIEVYCRWLRRFLEFHQHPHPRRLEAGHIDAFLKDIADRRNLAPRTRNQAASALTFAFRAVLEVPVKGLVSYARSKGRVPVVLTHDEVQRLLSHVKGRHHTLAALMYGTGARISEAVSLRIKDVDFELGRITIRDGKGGKARVVMLPERLRAELEHATTRRLDLHTTDLDAEQGWAPLPGALHRKIPRAGYEPAWQYLFAGRRISRDPVTGRRGRHPLDKSSIQRAVRRAVRAAGILKPATCHTLRHSFATEMLRSGYDIRTVQQLLGHKDVRTTMIYTHVVDRAGFGIRSPLDRG